MNPYIIEYTLAGDACTHIPQKLLTHPQINKSDVNLYSNITRITILRYFVATSVTSAVKSAMKMSGLRSYHEHNIGNLKHKSDLMSVPKNQDLLKDLTTPDCIAHHKM